MPLFDADGFSKKLVADLAQLRIDMSVFKALSREDKKNVLKKTMNNLIDVPGLPDFLEPFLFNFMVEWLEYFLKANLMKKENAET